MAKNGIRMTTAVARVLRQFLDEPSEPRYGYELMRATGLASGTMYVILARLQRDGWLTSVQEGIDPEAVGRPARRLYRLTGDGVSNARIELAELSEQRRPPAPIRLRARLQGGRS
jgi:PadR family transcriptional regulator, regulatory protein PadR